MPVNGSAFLRSLVFAVAISATLGAQPSPKRDTLDLYFIDVEGGQATLAITPAGESLLVDAGWPGNDGRDANRIIAAAKHAGISQIDYLLVTHYHLDHVGGVPDLMQRFPVKNLVDHGDTTETGNSADDLAKKYMAAIGGAKRIRVEPGSTLPLKGLELRVVAARGSHIAKAMGGTNPLCGSEERRKDDPSENARSIGFVLQFGSFRFIDLGDLTWNKELELACPDLKPGKVDLYLTTHHGLDASNPATLVHALSPRVAIMNNGARKGGSPKAWQIVKSSPGLQDLWQLHYSNAGAETANSPEQFIANTAEQNDQAHWILVSAKKDREFTVTNARNQFRKSYRP